MAAMVSIISSAGGRICLFSIIFQSCSTFFLRRPEIAPNMTINRDREYNKFLIFQKHAGLQYTDEISPRHAVQHFCGCKNVFPPIFKTELLFRGENMGKMLFWGFCVQKMQRRLTFFPNIMEIDALDAIFLSRRLSGSLRLVYISMQEIIDACIAK